MRSERDANRDATVVALYKGRATMQEIAEIEGISRQRVQQLLHRNGVDGQANGKRIDPLQIVAACRKSGVRTWYNVAEVLGSPNSGGALRAYVEPLGMVPAIERLFRIRKLEVVAGRRTKLIASYLSLADRLDRTPRFTELRPENGVPFWPIFLRYFGSIEGLRKAAGLDTTDLRGVANKRRSLNPACKRGHLYAETRDKYGRCKACIAFRRRKQGAE